MAERLVSGPDQEKNQQNRYLETLQLAAEKQFWQQKYAAQKIASIREKAITKDAPAKDAPKTQDHGKNCAC